ncbi:type II CRISPR RNA-guided endonuclease Cas9 [Mycoplasma sp. CSL7491-lung]|uniref:type II CRISPR RNA-guided endonuclease Cas9 n=1 Tax=Mycoplasma sp. CSL7491-lung TaxID=549718 RepID=UPI001C11AE76|nr:type II CRISPR RNA-guided endonuclease Cas9 [Mycoplasma sp. CSL7491-lung]MBU4693245.1 type II CRISPR RNA-guided endonuclease Cas9 [Mycoplasma sp. CSL7491-lung]
MNKENKIIDVTLGFDLGIGSVGWSIVDNSNNEVLELGSRLFDEPSLATDRRGYRSIRRSIRRKRYKNDKFDKLIFKYKDMFGLELENRHQVNNIYQEMSSKNPNIIFVKNKALDEVVESKELVWILHDYLQNRGFFYEVIEEENKESSEGKKISYTNQFEFPTREQFKFFNKFGYFKGLEQYVDVKFSHLKWKSEIEHVLNDVQSKKYENKQFNDFVLEFINIYDSIREYAKGPGSEHSYSEYGIYDYKEDGKTLYQKYNNIWDKTIGKCSIFVNENRAPQQSPSVELYNLLSDLNNVRHTLANEWVLSKNDKRDIINNLIKDNLNEGKVKNVTYQTILKYLKSWNLDFNLELKADEFKNADKKITALESTIIFIKTFIKNGAKLDNLNVDTIFEFAKGLDNIFVVISNYKEVEKRIKNIRTQQNIDFLSKYLDTQEQVNNFIEDIANNPKFKVSKTHSLSFKAIYLVNEDLLNTSKNLSNFKFEKDFNLYKEIKKYNENLEKEGLLSITSNSKYMDSSFLRDAVISPAVKTSLAETIKVFNQILKEYKNKYKVTKIGLEMPKENNLKSEREGIDKQNKKNKKRLEKIISILKDSYRISISEDEINLKTKQKLLLYFQQDGYDAYNVKDKIDVKKLIFDPGYTEIDHIIPYSISYDDSMTNKVVVLKSTNQAKSNKLPSEYLGVHTTDFKLFKSFWIENNDKKNDFFDTKNKEYDRKKENLLRLEINDKDKIEFANRNLNDTRYSSKVFLEKLNEYAKSHDKQFNVVTFRGKYTSMLRKMGGLSPKDRDHFSHHAIDASLLAISANNYKPNMQKLLFTPEKYFIEKGKVYDRESGESIGSLNEFTLNLNNISEIVKEKMSEKDGDENSKLTKTKDSIIQKVRYSRKVKKDYNIELFNQTTYGTKVDKNGDLRKIEKKSIFEITKYIGNKKEDNIVMKHTNPEQLDRIKNILANYKSSKNPFLDYTLDLFREYKEELCIDPENWEREARNFINNDSKKALIIRNKKGFDYIKNIKMFSDKVNVDNVSFIKNQNNKSFKESFKWVALLIYKNKKDNYVLIPVNAKIYKFTNNKNENFFDESVFIKENLIKEKELKNIPLDNKIVDVYYKGTMFINENEIDDNKKLVHIVGAVSSTNKIEYNYSAMIVKKEDIKEKSVDNKEKTNITKKKERNILATNSFLSTFKKINKSVLG